MRPTSSIVDVRGLLENDDNKRKSQTMQEIVAMMARI